MACLSQKSVHSANNFSDEFLLFCQLYHIVHALLTKHLYSVLICSSFNIFLENCLTELSALRFLTLDFKVTGNLTQVKHSVIMVERQVCNLGTVRYRNALAKANRWPVDDEFAVSVCELPAKDDNSDDEYQAYMKFIEQWGTVRLYEGLYEVYKGVGDGKTV